MPTGRLVAFSDGVIAVIITIMVLELKTPLGDDLAALRPLLPTLLNYVLSFLFIAIYWNNHHHLLHTASRVTASIMWANFHLLFWLSLVPFVTAWIDEYHGSPLPTASYGVILLMAAISYQLLQTAIVAAHGRESKLAQALGNDWKGKLSLACYISATALSFVNLWLPNVLYFLVAMMWIVPDRRLERAVVAGGRARE